MKKLLENFHEKKCMEIKWIAAKCTLIGIINRKSTFPFRLFLMNLSRDEYFIINRKINVNLLKAFIIIIINLPAFNFAFWKFFFFFFQSNHGTEQNDLRDECYCLFFFLLVSNV